MTIVDWAFVWVLFSMGLAFILLAIAIVISLFRLRRLF